jgi:uncharacterized protein (TIGR02594 family)
MEISLFDIAQRFVGTEEVPGVASNPLILAMLQLDYKDTANDEVPWCSAFVNFCAWLLRLPRSKSLAARSWLTVGTPVTWNEARVGYDVVVLARGDDPPGAEVLNAPGHVGVFAGLGNDIYVLGGNQGDAVSVAGFPVGRVLGVRRLWA